LNLQGIEYIQKIENLNRLPLGRNHARPRCTVHVWPTLTEAAWPTCTACAARVRSARPALAGLASACAARDGAARPTPERSPLSGRTAHARAVTALRAHIMRRQRRCHSGGGGANDGGQAPMAVRLPAGHGEGENSSPELLVDGEGEKTGSAAAFF
jgi:hypothetical protein